ncbi:DegT/DnrJ/EryC1/StrS family aminotransferase [Dactylosporangium siamense]|uniref:Aminotransferase n=1 Tax=Dactylosporangium siamense TaxID=685454 RepID=A0A919PV01_9ACTN|nr:DegT/DnrJ/EryC1/StrS family aminotransferase [Dactylosporangium siamense]GIG51330.1 aminotransferase [Dactylosporangium siamense]
MNDLVALHAPIADALAAAVRRVVDSGWYILGPEVDDFEAAFAAYCGVRHAVGVGNGTDAIELALAAVGAGRGSRVALAANAGGYGTTAVLALGAEPVYVDVDEDTATLDPALLDRKTFDAVLVTHLYGRLADMAALRTVADAHGAKLVEDCAQAHGAARDGRVAGAWGDAAAFSFYPTKNLGALGDAGAVVTADAGVAQRVRRLRQYGWDRKYHQVAGPARNSRLDELQAAVLGAKLPHLDGWNARRVAVAARYAATIEHPKLTLPDVAAPSHVGHLYVLRTTDRDALSAHLRAHGVPHDVHYPVPDHRQPVHGGRFAGLGLPVTERLCAEVLSLPCHPALAPAEVDRIAAALNSWAA